MRDLIWNEGVIGLSGHGKVGESASNHHVRQHVFEESVYLVHGDLRGSVNLAHDLLFKACNSPEIGVILNDLLVTQPSRRSKPHSELSDELGPPFIRE